MHVTTSQLRRGLCAAICTKRRLAQELDVLPFERRGDRALVAMAEAFKVPGLPKLMKLSPERYEVPELVLCPTCNDHRLIEVEPGEWTRCPECNPLPEPAEPGTEGARFRGRR